MNSLKTVRFLFTFCIIAVFISACSDVRLQPIPPGKINIQSSGEFCTQSPDAIKRYTKLMFVMDKSGSNQTTDPGANKRAGSLERFYNDNKDKDYLRWGMISFRDPGTKAEIGGEQDPIFVGEDPADEQTVREAIDSLRRGDNGGTPYGAALALTQKAIETDLRAYPDEDNTYMVFFVSDGEPTDGARDEASLRALVRNITQLSPGKVFLSTGYYDAGNANGTAISRLRAMAEEGNGKFVNFRDTDDFDFNELIVGGPTKEPWQVKNFVVYNLNASVCEDGKIDTDSDADGLCDKDEVKYGLDPTKRFSKPGGYGDYFRWREIKFGETLPYCIDRTDRDMDMLTECEEAYIYNSTPVGPSPDIRIPNRGDPDNPDTDLDGFLDGLEIFMFRDKSSAMNARDVLTTFDSEMDAGTQIKQHKNPMKWDPEAFAYDTKILPKEIRADTGQTCYTFSQTKLLIYDTKAISIEDNFPHLVHKAGENVVYVHFIQTPQREPFGTGVLMYSFQKLKAASQGISDSYGAAIGLKVRDDKFQSYVVPKNR